MRKWSKEWSAELERRRKAHRAAWATWEHARDNGATPEELEELSKAVTTANDSIHDWFYDV